MSFVSRLNPGEFVIDESNAHQFVTDPVVDGDRKTRGWMPRDWQSEPFGSLPFAAPFPRELIIPRSEWKDRVAEMEKTKTRVSDLLDQAGLPVKDQNGTNYCFPAGTLIRMADGSEKRIEDVKVLDEVVTAEGNVKRVLQTMVRHVDEPLLTPLIWGHSHLKATGGHPILTKRGYVRLDCLQPGDFVAFPKYASRKSSWVNTGDFLERRVYARRDRRGGHVSRRCIPGRKQVTITRQPAPDVLHLTYGLGRLVGFFLAEGHTSKWTTYWSFNRRETDTFVAEVVRLLKEECGADAHVSQRGNSVAQVALHGKDWAPLFESWCNRLSNGKTLHAAMTEGPVEFLEGVLTAWMDGDRHKGDSAVTVSRQLALNMFDIANFLGKMPVLSIHQNEKVDKNGILHQRSWNVGWSSGGPSHHQTHQDDRHMWRKVYGVESEPFSGYVFNLEVEDDHSYVAEGVGVHNCWINAPTHCVEIARVVQGEPMVILSPASAGAQIKGYRNVGGWGTEGIRWIAENGVCPVSAWPANAINRQYATQENKALAMQYRVTEWYDLPANNFDALFSCLLYRWPTAIGLSWWSHEVTAIDPVVTGSGYGIRMNNSWGTGWGERGRSILSESKGTPDDANAVRVAIPSKL